MPGNFAQLRRQVKGGSCARCHQPFGFLYHFSQQGGFTARNGRPVDGTFAQEERELRKPVEWSAQAYCSYSCFQGDQLAPKAWVWRLMRERPEGGSNPFEVSRHTSLESATKALEATIRLSDSKFFLEEPRK